jgi:hypothetical protein
VAVLTVYVFLYGRLYLVLSGLEKSILQDSRIKNIKPFENALATQSVFQLGTLLILPMIMEVGLEKGFGKALAEFVMMQLQLAPMFSLFILEQRLTTMEGLYFMVVRNTEVQAAGLLSGMQSLLRITECIHGATL